MEFFFGPRPSYHVTALTPALLPSFAPAPPNVTAACAVTVVADPSTPRAPPID